MKYLSLNPLKLALDRINRPGYTQEHTTSTVTLSLLNNYYPKEKFTITPEVIEQITGKRPDYKIEKWDTEETLHTFVEVKSLINSNFDKILDQLEETIIQAVGSSHSLSVYAIAMKGTRIAIFIYHSYVSLLDDCGLIHYKGFVPLNYDMSYDQFEDLNLDNGPSDYGEKLDIYRRNMRIGIETDPTKLRNMGVLETVKLKHPHIWDLSNKNHEDHIHNMFMLMTSTDPGVIRK